MNHPADYNEWFGRKRAQLAGNGLWLRGGEINTIVEYKEDDYKVLITRLSTYRDTADSFTHRLLYETLAEIPGVFPDLSYLPPPKDGRFMYKEKVPWLLGVNTKLPGSSFDMIALSNSILQEVMNIPALLERSFIPLKKKDRIKRADLPLIIVGGANASNLGIFYHEDTPVDGIFAGEDLALIREFFAVAAVCKKEKLSKAETLERLESVEGFFQSDRVRTVRKNNADNKIEIPDRLPVLFDEESASGAPLQISEGCPYFCSFCSESWIRKPYRELPFETVIEKAKKLKASCGLKSIDLYSFNFNIHSRIDVIILELSKLFSSVGLKSQRFDFLGKEPSFVDFIIESGKSSFTCGLEGISGKMRVFLSKNLSLADLLSSLEKVIVSNVRELKIFLIATGREEQDDYDEFAALLADIRSFVKIRGRTLRIVFSVTPLVRFPHTPMEFEDAFEIEHMRSVIKNIETLVVKSGFEFRKAADLYEYWVSQILARADRKEIYDALVKTVKQERFVYYQGIDYRFAETFRLNMKAAGISVKDLLKGRSDDDSLNPWTNIDTGVSRSFIKKAWKDAQDFVERNICLGNDQGTGVCSGCGACDDESRNLVTKERKLKTYPIEELREITRANKRNEKEFQFNCAVPTHSSDLPKWYIGQSLARAIMLALPQTVGLFVRVKNVSIAESSAAVTLVFYAGFEMVSIGESEALEINSYFSPVGELER